MAEQKEKKRLWRKRILGGMAVLTFLFLILGFFFIRSVVRNLPPLDDIENPRLKLATQVYAADGEVLGSLYSQENRVYVSLAKISPHVIDALIATEDIRFYSHYGIDPKSLIAIAKDIIVHQKMRGGSGISQQLARNLYNQIGSERSIKRKIKEGIVAIILESRYTKDEIIEAYLNTNSFYGNTYGIEMAARTLFNKPAAELEIEEAALLVGMLKGPTQYNPVSKPQKALERRNTVLSQMVKYGKLSSTKAKKLKNQPLGLNLNKKSGSAPLNAYFIDQVRKFVSEWAKENGRQVDLYADGLRIYTTLDSRMQKYAERAVTEHLGSLQNTFEQRLQKTGYPWAKNKQIYTLAMKKTDRYRRAKQSGLSEAKIKKQFEKKRPMRIWTHSGYKDTTLSPKDSLIHYMKFLETGFMVMDPHTGQIRAWVGGINHNIFKYDHVRQGKRQVGSTFKPFVYGAAIENQKISPCEEVLDIPVAIRLPDGNMWKPKNSGKSQGLINYNKGLAGSINRVSAYIMQKVGPNRVCSFAKKAGIESDLNCVPSLCLGTTDLSVYEMVSAYATLASGGWRPEPIFVTRIEDRHGNVLADFRPKRTQVMDAADTYTLTSMLRNVIDYPTGTAHRLRTTYKFTMPIAGKTGTTQNNSDGWFMGYTPELVAGVWVGCADRRIHFRSTYYGQGANMALPIWAIFMKYTYADKNIGLNKGKFTPPENFSTQLVCSPTKKPKPEEDGLPSFD